MNHYITNLQYLAEYNDELVNELHQVDTTDVNFVKINGEIVFKHSDLEGAEFYSGSIYDAVYEAEAFLMDTNKDNMGYFILGLSSSAIIKKLLSEKTETAWLVVIEKDIQLIKKFLEEIELKPILDGKIRRLVFFTGELDHVKTTITHFLHSIIGYYFLQAEVLKTYSTIRKDQEYYLDLFHHIKEHVKLHIYNLGNCLEDTLLGITNELANLKYVLRNKKLRDLRDRFTGTPIICVASGPSLDKQLELLKKAKGKSLIIAAASALRVLLKNKIVPDIVCLLERGDEQYELNLAGLDLPKDTALFALTIVKPKNFEAWPGPIVPCFKQNLSNSAFINEALGNFGDVYNGSSVAHMCYSLGYYFGGSPVVFIGQDLAYAEDGKTHSKDTFYVDEEASGISKNRIKGIQNDLIENSNEYNKVVYLDGYYGGKVKSRELWSQFLMWMEHQVQIYHVPTINATEGGVDIKGTTRMSFREVIDTYCSEPVKPLPTLLRELPNEDTVTEKEYLQRVYRAIRRLMDELVGIYEYAEENDKHMNELLEELSQGVPPLVDVRSARLLANTEFLIKWILRIPLINFYFNPIMANLHVKTNPISRINSIERLKTILEHQKYFLGRVINGAKDMELVYSRGFKELIEDIGYSEDEFEFTENEDNHNNNGEN